MKVLVLTALAVIYLVWRTRSDQYRDLTRIDALRKLVGEDREAA